MAELQQIPRKRFYRVDEVCNYADTQPYVLSFWESEFPQLKPEKSRSGQSMYRRDELEVVLRIKELLYEEEISIADARERIEDELRQHGRVQVRSTAPAAPECSDAADGERTPAWSAAMSREAPAAPAADPLGSVPRERYEDAVDEIAHLRLQLQEAETRIRRTEGNLERTRGELELHRQSRQRMLTRMEKLLQLLG